MRSYTVITPLAVPGRREPLQPGAPVEMDETVGDKLVGRGILARAEHGAAQPTAIDTSAMLARIRTLEEQLVDGKAALDAQAKLTQAAELRAQQAEAELVALRAQAAPPQEPLPESPPAEAKKAGKAK